MRLLYLLFIFLFTVFCSYVILGQELGVFRGSYEITVPQKIQSPLGEPLPAGTYTIGTGGYFPTIQAAFDKLSTDGVAGEVTLSLIDFLYTAPSDQYGFLLNGPIPGAGSNSRVTIGSGTIVGTTIEGNGAAVLTFLNTSYVTLIGHPQASLYIHTLLNNAYSQNDGIAFYGNSDHNIIQYLNFANEDYIRISAAIKFWGTSTSQSACDSNFIANNFIAKAGIGINISSYSTATDRAIGNQINGNIIGSEVDSLVAWGIQVEKCQNTIIENNIVQNIRRYGSNYYALGINSYWGSSDIIRNNIVKNIFTSNAPGGSMGISLTGTTGMAGNNNLVYNNMIYDIRSSSTQPESRIAGIQMWYQDSPKIYYNTVYLDGNGANPLGSAALAIRYGTNINVEAKNNIFINTRVESPYCASSIYFQGTLPNLDSDNNDFYYEPNANNCLIRAGGVDYMTLQEWQATGKDLASITEMPNFTTPYLHIDKTFPTNLERGATPIATITTDFDGDLRNATTPDIGADEFGGYTFDDPLPAGTYTIGTGGNFATIQSAFNKLSGDGVAGAVILELIDNLYTAPTDSFGFNLIGPIPGTGPDNRVTIKPAENKNVTVDGNGRIIFSFLNTNYATVDGVNLTGSTTLTIHSYYNNTFEWNTCLEFWDNSDHNIVQNTTFIGDDYTRLGGGPGFWTLPGHTDACDSNLIQNNFIKKAGWAIYVSSYNAPIRAEGNIIRGNFIGSETDSLVAWGIQIENCHNTIVEKNIIQNLKVTHTSGEILIPGINSYSGFADIIRNNVVHNLKNTVGYTCVGILLSGGDGSNNMVYNNMVYDIQSASTQGNSRVAGIQIWNQTNPKIYFNTVYLSGTGNGANPAGSAALYIYGGFSGSPGVDLKNNIFVNTRDESPYCASAIFDYNIYNLTSDYNDLYYDDTNPNNCLARVGGINYETLTEWQATGKDVYSYVEMPEFVDPYLHIDETIATYLESRGTPIAGMETDIDGDNRNATTPDIGADEFDGIFKPTGVEDNNNVPTEFALEQNYPNPFNPGTTIKYSIPQTSKVVIKVYDILGNEIALLMDEEKSVGNYEINWNASELPSGVYFYQLKAGDFVSTKKMLLLK